MGIWTPGVVALSVACVAAFTDIVEYRVRNILTLPLIVSGLVYHAVVGGSSGFATSVGGVAFGLGVLIVPWLLGLIGAGDAKLLAGVGAWLGLPVTVVAFIATAAASALYATVLIVYRGKLRESLMLIKIIGYRFLAMGTYFGKDSLVEQCYAGPERRLRVIPFGAMVPIGIVSAFLWLACIKGLY